MTIQQYDTKRLPMRFWNKVVMGPNNCWLWTATIHHKGYGQFRWGRTMAQAHRVSYALPIGSVPKDLQLDHLCRNRRCVNPGHLEPVTARENTLRGNGPAALAARRLHCVHGHLFDDTNTNTYITPRGYRVCRICRRKVDRERKLRRKENN